MERTRGRGGASRGPTKGLFNGLSHSVLSRPSRETVMANTKDLFLEDVFTFRVGPEKTPVKIPPSLLARHSMPLNAMITNGMKETQKKVADLPDEEAETLGYFLEWAITGIYRVAETTIDSDVEKPKSGDVSHYKCTKCNTFAATPTQINVISWCSTCKAVINSRCSRCNRQSTIKSSFRWECTNDSCTVNEQAGPVVEDNHVKIRDHFKKYYAAEEYPVGSHKHSTIDTFIESSLSKVATTGNLLAHAKVHVFAEKYLIRELVQMATHLLHRELIEYDVDKVGSSSLVCMIEYAYHNSGDADGTNEVSSLKHLTLRHAALKSDKLLQCRGFCKMLRDGGEVGVDFAKMLSKHVF